MIKKRPSKDFTALVYQLVGPFGSGKTRFASTLPGATLWGNVEDRIDDHFNAEKGDGEWTIQSVADLDQCVDYLLKDNNTQGHFRNFVLDTWTLIYKIMELDITKQYENDSNKFKKWDVLNKEVFRVANKLKSLKSRGINVVLVATAINQYDEVGNSYYAYANKRENEINRYTDNTILFTYEAEVGYKAYIRFPSNVIHVKAVSNIHEAYPEEDSFDPTPGFSETLGKHLYTKKFYEERRAYYEQLAQENYAKQQYITAIDTAVRSKRLDPKRINEAKASLGLSGRLGDLGKSDIEKLGKELGIQAEGS